MKTSVRIGLVLCALVGCGDDAATTPDSPTGNRPPPRVIPGGGIGDGAIDGVVNLYVMDDATRTPLANATVRVGSKDGTTDATGLFVAEGVVGPQTVLAKVANYRSEMWMGANGANMTLSLKLAADPTPAQANLTGSIAGFDQLSNVAGHRHAAIVTFSNDDKAGDAANNIDTSNGTNICDAGTGMPCNFAITTRTGKVALIAVVYDHDTKLTVTTADDTFTPMGWAYKTDLDVIGGVDQTGVSLAMIDAADLANVIVDFGTTPNLANVAAVIGVEVGASGTMQLVPTFATTAAPTVLAPKLTAIPGAKYRLTAIATAGDTELDAASFVLHRGQTSTSLSADPWLAVPTGVAMTRTTASWTALSGAAIQGVEYDLDKTHHLLSITSFDGSTSATIPDLLALPTTGTLIGRVTGLQGTVDLTNFSADDILTKITGFSAQPVQID